MHNGISKDLYALGAPLWKGNSVQSGGNPIISATKRVLSRPVTPVISWAWQTKSLPFHLSDFCLKAASLASGVGSRPLTALSDRLRVYVLPVPFTRRLPSSVTVALLCTCSVVRGVGNKPNPVASVGGIDTSSWQ